MENDPITVIRERYDKAFTSHALTPAVPSYVSGHASASGAASEVLAYFFPENDAELRRIAEEATMSRLYGGTHFRSDNDASLALGRAIGLLLADSKQYLPARLRLTPPLSGGRQGDARP